VGAEEGGYGVVKRKKNGEDTGRGNWCKERAKRAESRRQEDGGELLEKEGV